MPVCAGDSQPQSRSIFEGGTHDKNKKQVQNQTQTNKNKTNGFCFPLAPGTSGPGEAGGGVGLVPPGCPRHRRAEDAPGAAGRKPRRQRLPPPALGRQDPPFPVRRGKSAGRSPGHRQVGGARVRRSRVGRGDVLNTRGAGRGWERAARGGWSARGGGARVGIGGGACVGEAAVWGGPGRARTAPAQRPPHGARAGSRCRRAPAGQHSRAGASSQAAKRRSCPVFRVGARPWGGYRSGGVSPSPVRSPLSARYGEVGERGCCQWGRARLPLAACSLLDPAAGVRIWPRHRTGGSRAEGELPGTAELLPRLRARGSPGRSPRPTPLWAGGGSLLREQPVRQRR